MIPMEEGWTVVHPERVVIRALFIMDQSPRLAAREGGLWSTLSEL
jgi:hypothetical protein